MPVDLPPPPAERVVCSVAAAIKYGVPANVILAVAEQEAGRPGQWVRNTNATYDVGPMQLNTAYIATLARYGISAADVAAAGCFSYDLAAWRLRRHIRNDKGDLWTRVANYHSRTPIHNTRYRVAIMVKAARWGKWLTAHYRTYETMTAAEPARPAMASTNTRIARTAAPRRSPQLAAFRASSGGYVTRSITVSSN